MLRTLLTNGLERGVMVTLGSLARPYLAGTDAVRDEANPPKVSLTHARGTFCARLLGLGTASPCSEIQSDDGSLSNSDHHLLTV
jgi:hypothetical protein